LISVSIPLSDTFLTESVRAGEKVLKWQITTVSTVLHNNLLIGLKKGVLTD
jgi:hypothetical protein